MFIFLPFLLDFSSYVAGAPSRPSHVAQSAERRGRLPPHVQPPQGAHSPLPPTQTFDSSRPLPPQVVGRRRDWSPASHSSTPAFGLRNHAAVNGGVPLQRGSQPAPSSLPPPAPLRSQPAGSGQSEAERAAAYRVIRARERMPTATREERMEASRGPSPGPAREVRVIQTPEPELAPASPVSPPPKKCLFGCLFPKKRTRTAPRAPARLPTQPAPRPALQSRPRGAGVAHLLDSSSLGSTEWDRSLPAPLPSTSSFSSDWERHVEAPVSSGGSFQSVMSPPHASPSSAPSYLQGLTYSGLSDVSVARRVAAEFDRRNPSSRPAPSLRSPPSYLEGVTLESVSDIQTARQVAERFEARAQLGASGRSSPSLLSGASQFFTPESSPTSVEEMNEAQRQQRLEDVRKAREIIDSLERKHGAGWLDRRVTAPQDTRQGLQEESRTGTDALSLPIAQDGPLLLSNDPDGDSPISFAPQAPLPPTQTRGRSPVSSRGPRGPRCLSVPEEEPVNALGRRPRASSCPLTSQRGALPCSEGLLRVMGSVGIDTERFARQMVEEGGALTEEEVFQKVEEQVQMLRRVNRAQRQALRSAAERTEKANRLIEIQNEMVKHARGEVSELRRSMSSQTSLGSASPPPTGSANNAGAPPTTSSSSTSPPVASSGLSRFLRPLRRVNAVTVVSVLCAALCLVGAEQLHLSRVHISLPQSCGCTAQPLNPLPSDTAVLIAGMRGRDVPSFGQWRSSFVELSGLEEGCRDCVEGFRTEGIAQVMDNGSMVNQSSVGRRVDNAARLMFSKLTAPSIIKGTAFAAGGAALLANFIKELGADESSYVGLVKSLMIILPSAGAAGQYLSDVVESLLDTIWDMVDDTEELQEISEEAAEVDVEGVCPAVGVVYEDSYF